MTLEERVADLELTVKTMKCYLGDLHVESLKRKAEEAESLAKATRDNYNNTIEAIRSGRY